MESDFEEFWTRSKIDLAYSLSNHDILEAIPSCVVIQYKQLGEKSLDDWLLESSGNLVILIENEGKNHWILVQLVIIKGRKPFILFFDSYGVSVCNEFNAMTKDLLLKTKQDPNVLLKMLLDSKYPIHYSQYRLQKIDPMINTCGRWVVLKAYYWDVDEDDFADAIKQMAKEFSKEFKAQIKSDEIAVLMYQTLFSK